MFLAIPGGAVRAPDLSSIWQDGAGTAAECVIYGKPGTTYTVALEKETSVGSGIYTQVGTASVAMGAASSVSYTGFTLLSFSGATFPGTTGFNYRIRLINPSVGPYCPTPRTNSTIYYAQPATTQITAVANGGRTTVTFSWLDAASLISAYGSLWGSDSVTFLETVSPPGSPYLGSPYVHTVTGPNSPLMANAQYDMQVVLSYNYGHWTVLANRVTVS